MIVALWVFIGLTLELLLRLVWFRRPPRASWLRWAVVGTGGLAGGWLWLVAAPVVLPIAGPGPAASAVGALVGALSMLSAAGLAGRGPYAGRTA